MKLHKHLLLAAVIAALSVVGAQAAESPNVLLIVVDDMGYSDISSFGGEISTPNIDSLAKSGVKFTNFYTGPSCSATRSMLLSGTDCHIAGLGTMHEILSPNQVGKPGYEGYLNNRVTSFPAVLKDAGYHTYMAGKWHLGNELDQDPSKRGFEKVFTLLQGGTSHFDDEWMMYANYTPTYREDGVRTHVPAGFYSTEFYTDKIISYMDEQKDDKPFLAYLAYTAPHDPLHVPDEWLNKHKGTYDAGYNELRKTRLARMKKMGLVPATTKLSPWVKQVPMWESLNDEQKKIEIRRMELYAAMVSNIDHHIGRLLKYLDKSKKKKDTLVIFFSDNGANGSEMEDYPRTGEEWVERNSDNRFENWGKRASRIAPGPGWAQASSTPHHLYKHFLSEGGIRTPFIVSGAGVKGKGQTSHNVVHVMDLAPTLIDLAGTTFPKKIDGKSVAQPEGKSLKPFLSGKSESIRSSDDSLGWEYNNLKALRMGQYKANWVGKPYGPAKWQLFDMTADPGESNDLSSEKPEVLKKLITVWEKYSKDVGVIPPSAGPFADQ